MFSSVTEVARVVAAPEATGVVGANAVTQDPSNVDVAAAASSNVTLANLILNKRFKKNTRDKFYYIA